MAARKKAARQRRIINELNFQPTLQIADLAERLTVSSETIRRDLDDLTRQNLLLRLHPDFSAMDVRPSRLRRARPITADKAS